MGLNRLGDSRASVLCRPAKFLGYLFFLSAIKWGTKEVDFFLSQVSLSRASHLEHRVMATVVIGATFSLKVSVGGSFAQATPVQFPPAFNMTVTTKKIRAATPLVFPEKIERTMLDRLASYLPGTSATGKLHGNVEVVLTPEDLAL